MNNTDEKNRTVRPRTSSKDVMGTGTKTRRNEDIPTIRTASRSMKCPEKLVREKRASTPQISPEKSTMGRKFASTVMQPAFEQVRSPRMKVDDSYSDN